MMKKLVLFLSILVGSIAFFACNSSPVKKGPFTFFDQLVGTWQNKQNNQFEKWYFDKNAPRASSYKVLNKKDTIVTERIKVIKQGENIYYVAILFNQKNEAPVQFKKTTETDESITFENKQHDFPQKIVYQLLTPDSLQASISGMINGKEQQVLFPYTKVK